MTGWLAAAAATLGLLLQTSSSTAPTLDTIDREIRNGAFGNVDQLLVIRKGAVVTDRRYQRDYRAISRGRVGPSGCGEGCSDPAWMHEFNCCW